MSHSSRPAPLASGMQIEVLPRRNTRPDSGTSSHASRTISAWRRTDRVGAPSGNRTPRQSQERTQGTASSVHPDTTWVPRRDERSAGFSQPPYKARTPAEGESDSTMETPRTNKSDDTHNICLKLTGRASSVVRKGCLRPKAVGLLGCMPSAPRSLSLGVRFRGRRSEGFSC